MIVAGRHAGLDARERWRAAAAAASARAAALGRPVVAWATLPGAPVDAIAAFDVLRRADTRAALWARPGEGAALVGAGRAWECAPRGAGRFEEARDAWEALMRDAVAPAPGDTAGSHELSEPPPALSANGPIGLGGFAFSPDSGGGDLWRGFPAATLVLPHLSVSIDGPRVRVTLAALVEAGAGPDAAPARRPLELLAALEGAARAAGTTVADDDPAGPHAEVLEEFPAPAAWKRAVAAAAAAVRAGRLVKVVLARGVRVRTPGLDPGAALRRLRAGYPSCTLFAVARDGRCFLGATPERLARVRGGAVHTMALAGSARRGAGEDEDRAIGAALLTSPKDRVEHAVVVDALCDALGGMCAALDAPAAPSLLRVSNVQHLCTPLSGALRPGITALDAVGRLHPTPAVGGVPRNAALAWIAAHEGFDRGWYAGPVGWIDRRGEGEFAVALRCALAAGDEAVLFGGCGIVADSDPEAEYAEADLKLRPMLSALGANGVRR